MPVEIAALLGTPAAMGSTIGGSTVPGRGFELRGNAGGGAGRIQQERQDEDEGHEPFYSGGRVRIES